MKIKLFFPLVVILAFMLAGCATQAKYKDVLDSWVGASEQELIETWGVPDGVYNAGNLKFLSYRYSNQRVVYGAQPVYVSNRYGNSIYTRQIGGNPDMIISEWCKTTFTIDNDKVIKWTFNGNNCTAF